MFGPLVVCYLFLGGAGAGALFVSSALALLSPADAVSQPALRRRGGGVRMVVELPQPYRLLVAPGAAAGLVALGAGVTCLLADVGRADRVGLLLANPAFTYVAAGTWALVACSGLGAALLAAWTGCVRLSLTAVRVLEVALLAAAFVVMVYTGLLLRDMAAVPLWATPWLPALFALSSLSCGTALVLAAGQFSGAARLFGRVFRRLAFADAVAIILEILVAAAYVAVVLGVALPGAVSVPEDSGTLEALAASAQALTAGSAAWAFWGVFAVGGLAVPLALDAAFARGRAALKPRAVLAASACVLAGGFALRYCVVEAGLHPVLQTMM